MTPWRSITSRHGPFLVVRAALDDGRVVGPHVGVSGSLGGRWLSLEEARNLARLLEEAVSAGERMSGATSADDGPTKVCSGPDGGSGGVEAVDDVDATAGG